MTCTSHDHLLASSIDGTALREEMRAAYGRLRPSDSSCFGNGVDIVSRLPDKGGETKHSDKDSYHLDPSI